MSSKMYEYQKSTEDDSNKEETHQFSAEYELRKEKIINGLKDVEEHAGQTERNWKNGLCTRYVKAAAILLCVVILVPVTIHAAVTVYSFNVSQSGHTATGTIQLNEDSTEQDNSEKKDTIQKSTSDEAKTKSDDTYTLTGSDGNNYVIESGHRHVEINLGYLPAGMVRIEESKYDMADGEQDMGLSIAATQWDGESYDVVNRDVENAQTLNAGEYEYLLFERGGVDYSFDRIAYIPVKSHSLIITMYVGREISETDLNKIIAGMSINEDIGDDPSKWTFVDDEVYDDSAVDDGEGDSTDDGELTYTQVNVDEKFARSGYEMVVNDIKVYDNLCGISKDDIQYWCGGIDSRFVESDGNFKSVRCRRLNRTNEDSFSSWGDYNDSRLKMVVVDMSYEYSVADTSNGETDTLTFYLDRGTINDANELVSPETTNYYYSGTEISAQNSQAMSCTSPVYAEIDGNKTNLLDVDVTMNRDSGKHDLKVYFLVDKSELDESFMTISSSDGYSYMHDYAAVYLGGKRQ